MGKLIEKLLAIKDPLSPVLERITVEDLFLTMVIGFLFFALLVIEIDRHLKNMKNYIQELNEQIRELKSG